jgi:hypothetical protein
MILLVHLLLGSLIGEKINNPILAIVLAFLGHYLLDLFPHVEYDIENIKNKNWKKSLPDILRVILDFSCGILLIFLFSNNHPIVYVCAFFAILPDGLSLLGSVTKDKILENHSYIHQKKIHFLHNKKISKFWRISSQVIVAVLCIFFLKI